MPQQLVHEEVYDYGLILEPWGTPEQMDGYRVDMPKTLIDRYEAALTEWKEVQILLSRVWTVCEKAEQ